MTTLLNVEVTLNYTVLIISLD